MKSKAEEIENIIIEHYKSDDENLTNCAYKIVELFNKSKPAPSDEAIHIEAFKRQEACNVDGIKFEFNISDFKDGTKWMRDNYQPQIDFNEFKDAKNAPTFNEWLAKYFEPAKVSKTYKDKTKLTEHTERFLYKKYARAYRLSV